MFGTDITGRCPRCHHRRPRRPLGGAAALAHHAPPWSARNFVPYYSQLLSKEVQRGVADEILHRAREEIVAREARQDRG